MSKRIPGGFFRFSCLFFGYRAAEGAVGFGSGLRSCVGIVVKLVSLALVVTFTTAAVAPVVAVIVVAVGDIRILIVRVAFDDGGLIPSTFYSWSLGQRLTHYFPGIRPTSARVRQNRGDTRILPSSTTHHPKPSPRPCLSASPMSSPACMYVPCRRYKRGHIFTARSVARGGRGRRSISRRP